MNCPNCSETLRTIQYEGIEIETCDSCGGEWLDDEELKKIVKVREVRFDPEERKAIAQSATIVGVEVDLADRDLPCPKCGGQTDAINYGGDTGILIDRCTSCKGIWLDAGELEKIQMLVEGWDDQLPDDMKKYGPKLRKIEADMDERDDVRVSRRFGFVNSIINGIFDRWG